MFQLEILPGIKIKDTVFIERLKKDGYNFSFDADKLERPPDKSSLMLAGRQDASVGVDLLKILEIIPRNICYTGQGRT